MRRIVMALGLSALTVSSALAADAPAADKAGSAAEEMLTIIHLDVAMDKMADMMIKTQVAANPKLADFEDIMRAFLTKYISFEALKPDLVRIYSEHFTEKELREMIAFYRSPIGQKSIELMPTLLQQGGDLGKTRVNEHMDELKAAVEARVREKAAPAPDPPPKEAAPPGKDPGGR